jgi:hypothetical protein
MWRRRDERPYPPLDVDGALPLEGVLRMLDCVRVDFEVTREAPNRGERIARFKYADRNRPLNLVDHLPVDRTRILEVDLKR